MSGCSDSTIVVQNYSNIVNGDLTICEGMLNIFFGRNGTGKSTIAKALGLAAEGKSLMGLAERFIAKAGQVRFRGAG